MRIISWNINGIKNAYKKGHLVELLEAEKPDIICLQEVRCSDPSDIPGYKFSAFSCAERKGYSGTCIAVRDREPLAVYKGFDVGSGFKTRDGLIDTEGRITTAEFDDFYVVSVYVPNSKPDLSRLEWRTGTWDAEFTRMLVHLQKKKPVIACGDFNVARDEIDIHNAKGKSKEHGFTPEERSAFEKLLAATGMTDSFRVVNGLEVRKYSWWSNFAKSRERNAGWRIDYMLVSAGLDKKIKRADILTDVMGSDHAPCVLELHRL